MPDLLKLPRLGRPPTVTGEVQKTIIGLLEEGNSLAAICDLDGMPHLATVHRELIANAIFRDAYACAKEIKADHAFDEIESMTRDMVETATAENYAKVQALRLFVDTQKWRLARMFPKKYAERQIVQGDKDADPIQVSLAARLDKASKELRHVDKVETTIEGKAIEVKNDSSE